MSTTVKPRPTKNSATAKAATISAQKAVSVSTVPEQKFYSSYISREIIAGMTDMDVFDLAFENSHNVLIYGPTGPGKTSAALAYAAKHKKKFYAVPSNAGIEPSQLFGKFVMMPNGSVDWVNGPVSDIAKHGGVLLINEINFVPDRVGTVLFNLLDKRREVTLLDHHGETIRAHRPDCWCDLSEEECRDRWVLVIGDMNPDYEGTRPLNKALRNRFAVQLNWDYDEKVESKLVKSAALLKFAQQLRNDMARQGLDTPVSTNMLMEFESFCDSATYDFAVFNFVNHFADDERPVVSQVIKTHETTLRRELSAAERKARQAEEKKRKEAENKRRAELEAIIDQHRHQKVDWATHPDDPDSNKFLSIIDNGPKRKTGVPEDDEAWGVYGVTWNWGDTDTDIDVASNKVGATL